MDAPEGGSSWFSSRDCQLSGSVYKVTGAQRQLDSIVKSAKTIEKNFGKTSYRFRQYCFGEEGAFIDKDSLAAILLLLKTSIYDFGFQIDLIVSSEPGGAALGSCTGRVS